MIDRPSFVLSGKVAMLRLGVLVLAAGMTALVVSYCGGIAFVGLMVPHVARKFFSVTTARLVLASGLMGGIFLLWVDVAARTLITGQEIPIGVITSVIGSIFFLSLLRKM